MRLVCEQEVACGECRACRLAQAGNHPDIFAVNPEEGKTEITVDNARSINHFLALTPHMAPRRVALIDQADHLNRAAANAILKTLEEPPAESFLLLVSDTPARLLPTIRSRCQRLTLGKPERGEALAYLNDRKISAPETALFLAHGAPLAAEALPEGAADIALRLLQTLENLVTGAVDAPSASESWYNVELGYSLSLLTDILALLVSLILTKEDLRAVQADWRPRLRILATRLDLDQVFSVWDEALEAQRFLEAPLDHRLVWDKIFAGFEQSRA